MISLARFVIAHRWWVLAAWVLLAVAGGYAAPKAVSALTYDFGLPGQAGYEANQQVVRQFGSGGDNAPILLVVGNGRQPVPAASAVPVVRAVDKAAPGARVVSYAGQPSLLAADGRTGIVMVYPHPVPGALAYAAALPAVQHAASMLRRGGMPVAVTGQDALQSGGGGGGSGVLAETLFGGVGALVVLVVVFGSFLALMPLAIAVGSILTTFLIVWGLAGLTDVSFIVQYLIALIGLGVAIDYALLIVTRWREERGRGAGNAQAVERALATAGRSVLFSGVTVAISLAALIALPVPFLRSVGFTGLLIPVVSVIAALTLLPALLLVAGPKLAWPHRRSADPESRLWRRVGTTVVRHRWVAAVAAMVVLLALAAPVLGLRLGAATNASLASTGGPAAAAITRLDGSGLGAGLSQPVEILTRHPGQVRSAVAGLDGVAAAISPPAWRSGGTSVVEVWTAADASSSAGSAAAAHIRTAAERAGARVGGIPAQNADFVRAVYGNAWWVIALIVVVTFGLLARALRSIVLPVKALVLNVFSIGGAYGITVLIWQHGVGTRLLFSQAASGAITVWVPIAVFAFLFGLSMDYEVFLLTRIREEHDGGHDTDDATRHGVARTGRLITSAAFILFLAFIALSRVPTTDVKILATALALGIIIDATIVRGILAPALVAALGPANWWTPRRPRNTRNARSREQLGRSPGPAPATQHTAPDHPGEQRPPGRLPAGFGVRGRGMGDYERSTAVQVPPARLFSYLADVANLPAYLPRLTSATPAHGDKVDVTAHIDPPAGPPRDVASEAWMKVVTDGRALRWGAPGPDDYHGELAVDPGDDESSSRLTVRLHTDRVEGPGVDDGLDEALQGLKHAVEQAESR